MKRNRFDSLRRFFAPRSLRFQLLSRSLFILSALLILIGGLQYVLVKDFLFLNQANTMQTQIRDLPREFLSRGAIVGGAAGGGFAATPGSAPAQGNGAAGKSAPATGNGSSGSSTPAAGNGSSAAQPGEGDDRRPRIFFPDRSLLYVHENGSFAEAADLNGLGAPKLKAADYASIRHKLANRQTVRYRVAKDQNGTEQLLVFRLIAFGPAASGEHLLQQMGTATAPLQEVVVRQLLIFAALSLLALAGGLALYMPALRRTLQPLDTMVEGVRQIDAGNLDARFPAEQGQLEIDRLAHSFNGMLERLGASFEAEREAKEQMRRFIADASHELRTPLTSIHGFLEVLLRGAAERKEQLYAALHSMHGESTRIKKLVEDLLLLAKLDRAPQLHLLETRLDGVIQEMKPHLLMLAGARHVRFDLTADVTGLCDADKIKQIALNLFHNAVQHTDAAEGAIAVILTAEGRDAVLIVSDNGPGIPPGHLPHLFERFYRSDASRTRSHGGAGLGLAITKSIAEAHGGSIRAESAVGRGASFIVRLPVL